MLASALPQGADLLNRVVEAATARAWIALGDGLVLTGCDAIEIGACEGDLTFEAWSVRQQPGCTTIAAYAMARDSFGRERIAASGRFTFSCITDGQTT